MTNSELPTTSALAALTPELSSTPQARPKSDSDW
jgi:hypothetical protein